MSRMQGVVLGQPRLHSLSSRVPSRRWPPRVEVEQPEYLQVGCSGTKRSKPRNHPDLRGWRDAGSSQVRLHPLLPTFLEASPCRDLWSRQGLGMDTGDSKT